MHILLTIRVSLVNAHIDDHLSLTSDSLIFCMRELVTATTRMAKSSRRLCTQGHLQDLRGIRVAAVSGASGSERDMTPLVTWDDEQDVSLHPLQGQVLLVCWCRYAQQLSHRLRYIWTLEYVMVCIECMLKMATVLRQDISDTFLSPRDTKNTLLP
jgi:hypothetical protein